MEDITKTGPVGLPGLKGLNQSPSASSQYFQNLQRMTAQQLSTVYLPEAQENVGVQLGQAGYGDSTYDEAATRLTQVEDLNELRAQEQSGYSQVVNGLAKGVVLALTTFLDGTVGLLVGAGQGIANLNDDDPNTGFWSGLWDNDFSKAMQKTNENFEQWLPNYYTQEEKNSPWYENIFTANFLGDKFIKNLGFSVGAIYSGGVWSKALKATKLPEIIGAVSKSSEMPAMVTSTVGATISAVNEGRIEALNNSKDWFEYQKAQLDDEFQQRTNAALEEYESTKGSLVGDMETGFHDPAYAKYKATLEKEQAAYNAALGKLNEDRIKMGNADLLLNIPILATSNYLQFAKFYANGFKTARRTANIAGRAGEYVAGSTKRGAAWAATKGALAEGTEEISQKAASEISGTYYATDVNNFYKARTDRAAEQETLSWLKAFSQGINKTVNDGSSWEEFFIGSLTGALGIPTFRSAKAADGSFQSPVVMEGGIYNHWREYSERRNREQEIVDYMNNRVQSPEFLNYYQGLIRHNKYQRDMDQAVEDNDEFNFKNAEHAQFVSDIVMFDNASKLEDLVTLINSAYDTSDANLQSIVENTTSTTEDGKKIGPFIDSNGNPMYATPEGKREMIEKLTQNKESMSKAIDTYVKAKNSIDISTGQQLSDSQLEELAWMKSQLSNWSDRAVAMSGEVKQVIGKVIGNLDSFRRFQDAIRTEEGQNHAELTDRYNRADRNVRDADRAISSLNAVRSLDDTNLATTLAKNPDFVRGLMREVVLLDDNIIEADEKEDMLHKLEDIVKLGNAASVYNAKFREYLDNPGQQVADHDRADQENARAVQAEANASLRQRLDKATSVAQFKQILNTEQDAVTRESVLQAMEADGNQVAKNYKETLQYDNELRLALSQLGETDQTTQDALSLWQEQVNLAENLEQIAYPDSVAINNEEAFMEDSGGDVELAGTRFENARYALQRAMSKVNNDIKFKNRFSEEYRKPVDEPVSDKGTDKDETGDSGTPTVPHVNPGAAPVEVPSAPVGNVTAEMVAAENSDANRRVETQRTLDQRQQGQRRYYRPAVPELHIEASKEGDFRPFDVVVAEREVGVDFSGIYSYLRDNGAFNYVNAAKLKPGDTLGFMIDPEFNDHTIFLVDTRNNQIVGSIDESDASVARYEGLEGLIEKIRDEYQTSSSSTVTNKVISTQSSTSSNGRVRTSEVHEISRTTDREGTIVVELEETITSDSKKQSLVGRKITNGGLEISVDSDIIDWKRQASGGRREDGSVVTPEEVTAEEEQEAKEQMSILLENARGRTQPLYASTISYAKDGRIIAKDKKGNIIYLKSDPLSTQDTSKAATFTSKFFATPQVRVSKMMVGRIPFTSEERSLADIPGVLDGDTKPILGIIKNGVLTTNEKIDDRLIIKPVDMAQKEGRLYLLIPNAAGTYSPAAVRVKHFNTQEFNLDDATVAATPIGKGINEALDKLADATSQDDVSIAMKELAQDIYMQDVMVTWFDAKAGSGIVVSKKVRKPDGTYEMVTINGQEQIKEEKTTIYFQSSKKSVTINGMEVDIEAAKEMGADLSLFGQPRDIADIRKDILNTILRYNLPLQVSVSKINESSYNNRVIKSNILTSNLREAKVIGSWFTTDYFDNQGNLQRAVSPASVKPTPGRRVSSPVGGTEGVMQGTRVVIGGTPYIVDLKSSIAMNEKTGEKRAFSAFNSQSLIDMAWAQETFGDATESSRMTENKIITPKGDVLDRSTGHYITGEEAQRIKDKIAGRNRETENRIAQSKRVIADIYENQKKVDKARTDKDYYYILEEDGQYHQYSRVHSRLGDNWLGERTETENSKRALEAGTAVDRVIRDFFTSKEAPVRPETLSEGAFIDLITKLTEIKSKMEQLGETFMTNNIVLFQKYADGTRIAGEVDILSVDKNGNFKIYDVKTSRYSFSDRYFTEKSSMQRMSTKDYYTLQLSAYQNLFESQYGVRPTRLAILPFVLTYDKDKVNSITQEKGIPITYNPAVNVPLASAVQAPKTGESLPIFDSTMETMITKPEEQNRVLPENAFEEGGEIGYYEKDGKLYTGYLKKIGEIEVTYGSGQKDMVPIHVTKVRDRGFGRAGEFGASSEYLTVFPNGKAISTRTNDTNDDHAAEVIMKALSAKPEKVLALSNEKTQIHNPRMLEELEAEQRNRQYTPSTPAEQGGASRTVQRENAVNQKAAKRTRHKLSERQKSKVSFRTTEFILEDIPSMSGKNRSRVKAYLRIGYSLTEIGNMIGEDLLSLAGARGAIWDSLNREQRVTIARGYNPAQTSFDSEYAEKGYSMNTEYQVEDIESLITSELYKSPLFQRVLAVAKQFGITVQFQNRAISDTAEGLYGYNKIYIQISPNSQYFEQVLMHELIHSVTQGLINREGTGELTEEQEAAVKMLRSIFEDVQGKYGKDSWYGLSNLAEFAAELANPEFREFLKSQEVEKGTSLWDRVKNFFKRLFGNKLELSDAYLEKMLENPIKDTNKDSVLGKVGGRTITNKSLSLPEKAFIQEFIMGLSEADRGLGRANIYNPNTGYYYTVNFAPSIESHLDNLRTGGDGFEVIDRRRPHVVSNKSTWENLTSENKQALQAKGWTQEQFNRISQAEREQAVECVGL